MADPILPGYFKTMAVFQHQSGLPEDRFINTWYWRIPTVGDWVSDQGDVGAKATEMLDAFYQGTATNGQRVAGYMPNDITSLEYRTYALEQPPPRDPAITQPGTPPVFSTSASLPYECSVVLSLRTALRHRSGRGRLYLGPFVISAVSEAGAKPTIVDLLRDTIIDRATNVLESTHPVEWAVVSGTRLEGNDVIGGYVDDAWDTQRRRGSAPTGRTAFGQYVPE